MAKQKTLTASVEIFACNLMKLMTSKGVDVDDMHKDLGLEKPRIRRWIRAGGFPTHEIIVVLCNYFEYYDIYKLLTTRLQFDSSN